MYSYAQVNRRQLLFKYSLSQWIGVPTEKDGEEEITENNCQLHSKRKSQSIKAAQAFFMKTLE